jgi:hypothetical protein
MTATTSRSADTIARGDSNLLDAASLVGVHGIFHLHGLEDDNGLGRPRRRQPTATATLTMVPCIGTVTEPDPAPAAWPPPERWALAATGAEELSPAPSGSHSETETR